MAKFRVRARTVDMLGRQQIAGIPTAISELFKNSHDAYARTAEVDYFRSDRLFVLRDDGLGMTREDFEQRWLTLGTDSKVGKGGLQRPPKDSRQEERPVLGEKGIGRLAIAVLGPQVLVLSRARRDGTASSTTVAAYLHWGLFALPGLDIEDISVPLREFPGATLPDAPTVREMVEEASSAVKALGERVDPDDLQRLLNEMAAFTVDPAGLARELGPPSLDGDGCGTHFYIMPADELIEDDIDGREDENKATRFEKNLIGFTNTMTPGHRSPPIVTRFRDYIDEGAPIERIGEKVFFTPSEFSEVDHHVKGRFDEYGQFSGHIGVYQGELEPYVLNWDKADGQQTACGPFSLSFAYLQGAAKDSLVPTDEWVRLKKKLDRHGGLYIYRDGVRVQPYGDSDYDFLDVERRRTLSASYYFYSYRRMFGVIELTSNDNGRLTEKAGREGFRENRAYRDFRSILINFFIQSAADFFREEGRYAQLWEERKAELNRLEKVRKKKSSQVTVKRNELRAGLDKFFSEVDMAKPEERIAGVVRDARARAEDVAVGNHGGAFKATMLLQIEKDAFASIASERKALTIAKPRGVGLSRQLSNEWGAYLAELERLEANVLLPAEEQIASVVSRLAQKEAIPVDHVARLDSMVRGRADESLKIVKRLKGEAESTLADVIRRVREATRNSFREVNHVADDVIGELDRLKRISAGPEELFEKKEELERRIESVFEAERSKLERIRDQLGTVTALWDADGYDSAELAEALEEELDALKEQRDVDLELAQIGMAINTINHEFEKTVGALRDGFRRLKAWAQENPVLDDLYHDMRNSFDHLDGYLSLFTPLDRRLRRKEVEFTGKDIYDFLRGLFDVRLKRHAVEMNATNDFLSSHIFGYTSSFYPVFVNMVDNAIFWLQRVKNRPRVITLRTDGDDLLVSDNGPGVSVRDRDNIFSLNFSRRPGGRGMGLYISRQTLKKIGYDLVLDLVPPGEGATFRVARRANSEQEEA